MWGLRIIPMFFGLTAIAFLGVLFIEANPQDVTIQFFSYTAPQAKLGLVVLVAGLAGMTIAGVFCSIEMLAVQMHNRRLKKRIAALATPRPNNVVPLRSETPGEPKPTVSKS